MNACEALRGKVRDAYSGVAERPSGKHPFPVGRLLAEDLGYPAGLLSELPPEAVEAFAGVSNVAVFAELPAHGIVLDLGCGAGLDTSIAARRSPASLVIGADFSRAMLGRARAAASNAGIRNAVFCQADAERLPLAAGSVDVALVNGIFNLNPARDAILGELGRVVRPGGTLFAAELLLEQPLPPEVRADEANWFA